MNIQIKNDYLKLRAMQLKFKKLVGDEKFVSKKLNNGDWDYWLVIETIDFMEATGELYNGQKYNVSVKAVSPQAAGLENLKRAFDCYGIDPASEQAKIELVQVECLESYGISAQLESYNGNNLQKLLAQARKFASVECQFLFGFIMDRPENRIGNTGWDFISGKIGF